MKLSENLISKTCFEEVKDIWLNSPDAFPKFVIEIHSGEKENNEAYISDFSAGFQNLVKSYPVSKRARQKWKREMLEMIDRVLQEENILGVHKAMSQSALILFREDINICLRRVREFAPELSMESIGQAIRNYTVYAMLCELYGIQSAFHPAIFGYSMLYPFTDNYIDSKSVSSLDKEVYNQIIRDKIAGRTVSPRTSHQEKTCELLSMIESRYPRENDSTVYLLLELMLNAQQTSMRQQEKDVILTNEERLDISLYKGGLSVLIDRFFVDREISEGDLTFYLAFGFFLQLADDLQDIKADSNGRNQTLFTVSEANREHEKLVNKLLHFVQRIFSLYEQENDKYKMFILNNCYFLVFSSVAGSKEFFSSAYLEKIAKYLPVSLSFLQKSGGYQAGKKDIKMQEKSLKMLDELIL